MAASGRSTTAVKGTDGNDYAYRQTIDSRYQTSANAKVTLERLFVPFAALSAVLAGYSFLVANPVLGGMDLGSITGAPLGHQSLAVDIVFAWAFLVTGWLGARVAAGLHNSVLTMFYSIASAALVLLTATAAARAHGLVALIAPPSAGSQTTTASAAATAILAALHAVCLALGLIALRASRALQTSKSANKSKN